MAEKMTRRTFMKSAAAAAAAISLSGVLTGCGGGLAQDEVQIGPFTVTPAAAAGRADSTATCSKLSWAKQS